MIATISGLARQLVKPFFPALSIEMSISGHL